MTSNETEQITDVPSFERGYKQGQQNLIMEIGEKYIYTSYDFRVLASDVRDDMIIISKKQWQSLQAKVNKNQR